MIDDVGDTTAGGIVTLVGNRINYVPPRGFLGIDTFEYTITDGQGGVDTATVTVTVAELPPQVNVRLEIVDGGGDSVDTLVVGDEFVVRGFVEDVSVPADGVFSAYVDVTYDAALASVSGPIGFDLSPYTGGRSGSTTTDGLIDEVGGTDGLMPLGGGEFLLFSVPFTATEAGTFTVEGDPADILPLHETSLFGALAVDPSLISFTSDSVEIFLWAPWTTCSR